MNEERKQFMKTCKPVLRVLAVVLAFACIAIAADARKLHLNFRTVQIKNAQSTHVYGVNNAGVMVGRYVDSAGVSHGFIKVGEKVRTLDDPNWSGTYNECEAINSHNVIVGDYINSSNISTSYIYQKGKQGWYFRDIGPPNSQTAGINDSGVVTGAYVDSHGHQYGYVWHRNTWTRLDKHGAVWTYAVGINNKGLITVQWGDKAGNAESSLYNLNTKRYIATINVPGALNTYAHGIDSAGDVVFNWDDSTTGLPPHGALCTNCWSKTSRKYYKFDDPKGTAGTTANGINDHGLIVGVYLTNGGAGFEGFKATYHFGP